MLDRDVLYHPTLTDEERLAISMGIPVVEGLEPGDAFEVVSDGVLTDADIGVDVEPGFYKVTDVPGDGLIHVVWHCPSSNSTGGKEYAIRELDMEPVLASGDVILQEDLEAYCAGWLTEDGQPGKSGLPKGYIKSLKPVAPFMYNYLTWTLFRKGYLQKFRNKNGETTVQYRRRAFPKYASGNPNPEYRTNKRRAQRRRRRAKRRKK